MKKEMINTLNNYISYFYDLPNITDSSNIQIQPLPHGFFRNNIRMYNQACLFKGSMRSTAKILHKYEKSLRIVIMKKQLFSVDNLAQLAQVISCDTYKHDILYQNFITLYISWTLCKFWYKIIAKYYNDFLDFNDIFYGLNYIIDHTNLKELDDIQLVNFCTYSFRYKSVDISEHFDQIKLDILPGILPSSVSCVHNLKYLVNIDFLMIYKSHVFESMLNTNALWNFLCCQYIFLDSVTIGRVSDIFAAYIHKYYQKCKNKYKMRSMYYAQSVSLVRKENIKIVYYDYNKEIRKKQRKL